MRLAPGDTLGRYTILEEAGHGGMATVYRAYQPSLQRQVAIKVLPDFLAGDEGFRERFAREAETIAQLRHPNIVSVYDHAEEAGTPYIVTEFVDGETLGARLGRPLSLDDTLAVLRPLASALDYAHSRGVLHRDVKPSNIMIARDGTPVLTDFGLSRLVGSLPRLTWSGAPIGTPEYMAPEQAAGEVSTAAVDRYALGIVAFEMLTGRVPFSAETPLAVLLAHLNRPLPRASTLNPRISPEVDEVLQKALEKDPASRYASAAAFVESLGEAAAPWAVGPGATPAIRSLPSLPTAATSEAAQRRPALSAPVQASRPAAAPVPEPRAEVEATSYRNPGVQALLEAVQHPAGLIPLTLGLLATVYLVLLAPVTGYAWLAGAIAAVSALAAAAALIARYPRERDVAEQVLEERQERDRRVNDYRELARLHDTLEEAFSGDGPPEGLKALNQLQHEFVQLQPALIRRPADPLSVALVPSRVVETYRLGLSLLIDAQNLANVTRTSNVERLRSEIPGLEHETASLRGQPEQAQRLSMLEGHLASHRERVRKTEEQQLGTDQLFYQAQRCEATLHLTRIDLAAIRTGSTESSVDAVLLALQSTIDRAKEVQAEIRKLGY